MNNLEIITLADHSNGIQNNCRHESKKFTYRNYIAMFEDILLEYHNLNVGDPTYYSQVAELYSKVRAIFRDADCSECRCDLFTRIKDSTLLNQLRDFAHHAETIHESVIGASLYG
jgi:hypothetical protein